MVPSGGSGDQRALWSGFSNALGRAVELVGTTVIFVLLGVWLDGRFGTRPLFTVTLGVLAMVGLGISAYYRYAAEFDREQEGKPWTRSPRRLPR